MNLATLTTIIPLSSLAPLPATLPSYELECRAGAMTSLNVVKMHVSVQGQSENRFGMVRTESGTGKASVKTTAIMLTDSIGGRGFADQLEYEVGGKRSAVRIAVRGAVEDGIIEFRVQWNMDGQGIRRSTAYVGVCQPSSKAPIKGTVH